MSNNNQNQTKSKNQAILPIAATVGVLLLIVIGFLAYNNITKANELEQTVFELEESENLRAELETQYNQALVDLESQKTSNEELNGIIDQQMAELEDQKARISRLLGSKGKLDKARIEIENLKTQVEGYIVQIEDLKAQNDELAGVNAELNSENDSLNTNLQTKETENQELSEARAQLVSERDVLTGKVNVASIIKLREVTATPEKVKGSGKAVSVKSAKSTDRVKVCITTLANEVVSPGMETFFVRIVNPIGETLAIEDMGSGMLTNKKTGEEIRYTTFDEMDYSNEEEKGCMLWAPTNTSYMKGTYTVEVYNKGYLAGMGAFSLK